MILLNINNFQTSISMIDHRGVVGQFNRAGIIRLRDRMRKQLEEIRERRLVLKKLLKVDKALGRHSRTCFHTGI